jgi:uncharacterized membrane protein YgdD (TMEM256/DUF423 family)
MYWIAGIVSVGVPLICFLLAAVSQRGFPINPGRNARYWGAAAALLGLMGVAVDAYITHGAGSGGSTPAIASDYMKLHAIVILGLAVLCGLQPDHRDRIASAAGWLLFFGILGFCGALFLRTAGLYTLVGLAPLGGVALMLGWVALAIALFRRLKA